MKCLIVFFLVSFTFCLAQLTEELKNYTNKSTMSLQSQVDYYFVIEGTKTLAVYDAATTNLISRYSDASYNASPYNCNIGNKVFASFYSEDKKSAKVIEIISKATIATFSSINGANPMLAYAFYTKDKKIKIYVLYGDNSCRFYTTNLLASSIRSTDNEEIPTSVALQQNYPNPFNPTTSIQYSLDSQSDTQLKIYDIAGRLVRTFEETNAIRGEHITVWDGRDNAGKVVATGTYVYQLISNGQAEAKKMLLLK